METRTEYKIRPQQSSGILSDIQIADLVTNELMINPYYENKIRFNNAGEKVISFGQNSYGYDVTLSNEFIVYLGNTVADPKNPLSLSVYSYTIDEPYYDLEPNTAILAHTIEELVMPSDVTGIVLGKSTYARCFSGDTEVELVDGIYTFEELVERSQNGEDLYGYGVNDNGDYVVQKMYAPRLVDYDDTVLITIDNGEAIECTSDHLFMLRDGSYRRADALRANDSLMPLYIHDSHGYQSVYNPVIRKWRPTHLLVKDMLERHYGAKILGHTHHKDGNKHNNHPSNLEFISSSDHTRLHNSKRDMGAQSRAFWDSMNTEERRTHYEKGLGRPEVIAQSAKTRAILSRTPEARQRRSEISKRVWSNASEDRRNQQRAIARTLNVRSEITADSVRQALQEAGTKRGAARLLKCDCSVFRRFPEVMREYNNLRNNHKVLSVKKGKTYVPVYCLTSETGNFALSAGVIVKNCGLLVNATPLEAGWKGQITLELRNLETHPIRLYIGEGIAQILFFRGNLPPKEAYNGAYQGQSGVTLPFNPS